MALSNIYFSTSTTLFNINLVFFPTEYSIGHPKWNETHPFCHWAREPTSGPPPESLGIWWILLEHLDQKSLSKPWANISVILPPRRRTESLHWWRHKLEERQRRESGSQSGRDRWGVIRLLLSIHYFRISQVWASGGFRQCGFDSSMRRCVYLCVWATPHKLPLTWSNISRNCGEDPEKQNKVNCVYQIIAALSTPFPRWKYGCVCACVCSLLLSV